MKYIKIVFTMIGVMALIATSLVAGNVSADDIDTTLTVETTAEICPPAEYPSFIQASGPASGSWVGGVNGIAPGGGFTSEVEMVVGFHINDCHAPGRWNAYVSFTDFTDGSNTIPVTGNLQFRGHGSIPTNWVYWGLALDGGVANTNATTQLYSTWIPFDGSPRLISYGTSFNNPENSTTVRRDGFSQRLQIRMSNIPATQAPGVYTSQIMLTLTLGQP